MRTAEKDGDPTQIGLDRTARLEAARPNAIIDPGAIAPGSFLLPRLSAELFGLCG